MSCCSKEKMERNDYHNTCQSHAAKSDREMYRICPSKLSKKELEDLYFTLLENNLELKKTINGQQDRIRVLSTQVQRMTNTHGKMLAKEMKECSTGTKAFVNEQKDFITELKETNQRMAERIQQLNMRLCSAKQFSKTTPPQMSNSRRFRAATASTSKKHNNCLSKEQDNEQVLKLSTSSQWEDSEFPKSDQPCEENKCRTLMEELKIKIVTLQKELSNVHDEYSTRIGRLETEVSEVRKENIRVCSERSASEQELQNTVKQTSAIRAQCRLNEAKCSELTTELAIEKRKVAELETQLKAANMSDKVNKTIEEHLTTIQDCKCHECECPPPQDLSTQATKIQCDLCGCAPSKNTSTPRKNENAKCIKCCFTDKQEGTETPPTENGKFLSPGAATTRSPGNENDGTKSSKTADDSGYQDSDELILHKQNRELMRKILKLQNQVDRMKIQDKIPVEQIEYNKSIENGNYESTKQAPFPTVLSEEHLAHEPGKILSIKILGDSKEAVRTQNWDSTQAKTTEDAAGSLHITERASSGEFSTLDLTKDDYRERNKTESPKLKIIEKKKHEIAGTIKPESGNVLQKLATSNKPGPGVNPEKLKYLEAEGIIAEPELGEDMSKLKEVSLSLTESVPSNPELGFAIPSLASKPSREKYKTESGSGHVKKSLAAGSSSPPQERDDPVKFSMTEALVANNPAAPQETDEMNKKKEDCENCVACSFDKECELKQENATNHNIINLATGMQKEHAKKHDQHNSLQIPGPIPTSDNNKREKMRNLFSHFKKDRSSKQKKENFVLNPKIYRQQTTATTDDLDKRQLDTDSIKIEIEKILTYDKKDHSIKRKNGTLIKEALIVNPKIYAQNMDGPVSLPDVPLLDKGEDSQDAVEGNSSRIVLSINNDLDPTYQLHSVRKLPTLLTPTNSQGNDTHFERKADVAQRTDQKLVEKSSQAQTNMGIQAHDKENVKSARDQRHEILMAGRGTYTVNSKQTDTSPDNTDLEMSYLSDLPMEKEKRSPCKARPLSPGEDRTTTFTNTPSYYSPPTYSLLSEGEMPATTSKRKRSEPDNDRPYLNAALSHKLETPAAQQMEVALQAISEELWRCRAMLHAHRPAQMNVPSAML